MFGWGDIPHPEVKGVKVDKQLQKQSNGQYMRNADYSRLIIIAVVIERPVLGRLT